MRVERTRRAESTTWRATLNSKRLTKLNDVALANRPFTTPGYVFMPISTHDRLLHMLKRRYPFRGYVDVHVDGLPAFVMFSNNDDLVAQTYFWFGPDAFESLSMRAWARLARDARGVFDVGAFSGVYSLAAATANRDARVWAVEPLLRTYARLIVNIDANRLRRRVTPLEVAASDEDGVGDMHVYYGPYTMAAGSSLLASERGDPVTVQRTETLRLDTIVQRWDTGPIDLVKIDVERAEEKVVSGAMGLIERDRPHLIIEVARPQELKAVVEMLVPLGYSWAVVNEEQRRFDIEDGTAAEEHFRNVLFAPTDTAGMRRLAGSIAPR